MRTKKEEERPAKGVRGTRTCRNPHGRGRRGPGQVPGWGTACARVRVGASLRPDGQRRCPLARPRLRFGSKKRRRLSLRLHAPLSFYLHRDALGGVAVIAHQIQAEGFAGHRRRRERREKERETSGTEKWTVKFASSFRSRANAPLPSGARPSTPTGPASPPHPTPPRVRAPTVPPPSSPQNEFLQGWHARGGRRWRRSAIPPAPPLHGRRAGPAPFLG